MIARTWSGQILTEDASAYRECAELVRLPRTRAAEGNLGVWILARDLDAGYTEVLIISHWESLDTVAAWAGYDIDNPIRFAEEEHFFITHAPTAHHYTLIAGDPATMFPTSGAG